jgi:hypothetical protein
MSVIGVGASLLVCAVPGVRQLRRPAAATAAS